MSPGGKIRIWVFLAVFIMIFAGCAQKKRPQFGGDRDKHGCIGSAGYTWCEKKHKCLRTWEEKCE